MGHGGNIMAIKESVLAWTSTVGRASRKECPSRHGPPVVLVAVHSRGEGDRIEKEARTTLSRDNCDVGG